MSEEFNEMKQDILDGFRERLQEQMPELTKAACDMLTEDLSEQIDNDYEQIEKIAEACQSFGFVQNQLQEVEEEGHDKEANVVTRAGRAAKDFVTDKPTREAAQKAIGALAVGGTAGLAGHNFLKAKQNADKINQYADFRKTLQDVSTKNELLNRESKEKINQLGDSVFKFAPQVANDPLVLEQVMSNAVLGNGLDPATVRALQELEEKHQRINQPGRVTDYIAKG